MNRRRREFLEAAALAAGQALAPLRATAAANERKTELAIGVDTPLDWLQTRDGIQKMRQRFPGLRHVLLAQGGEKYHLTKNLDRLPAYARKYYATEDDRPVRQAIENAHEAGLKVFASFIAWKSEGWQNPPSAVRYIDGRPLEEVPIPKYALEAQPSLCPNRSEVRAWQEAVTAGLMGEYEVDGCMMRHSNYNHIAYIPSMFACWCEECRKFAGERGYDFEAMRRAMRKVLDEMPKLDRRTLSRAADSGTGLIGLFCALAGGVEPARWFDFRADGFTEALRRIRVAGEQAARLRDAKFGCMTYYPSFAMLVGHRYSDFERTVSFAVPQFNHWDGFYPQNLLGLANWLLETVRGLNERDALRLAYQLIGVDGLPVPESFSKMPVPPHYLDWEWQQKNPPKNARGGVRPRPGAPRGTDSDPSVLETSAAELYKVRARLGNLPAYVCFSDHWPAAARKRLDQLAADLGFDAIWYQVSPSLLGPPA